MYFKFWQLAKSFWINNGGSSKLLNGDPCYKSFVSNKNLDAVGTQTECVQITSYIRFH